IFGVRRMSPSMTQDVGSSLRCGSCAAGACGADSAAGGGAGVRGCLASETVAQQAKTASTRLVPQHGEVIVDGFKRQIIPELRLLSAISAVPRNSPWVKPKRRNSKSRPFGTASSVSSNQSAATLRAFRECLHELNA